ncbi:MAG: Ppx/GppA family phosphatase [Peptococcaceae bacterium]
MRLAAVDIGTNSTRVLIADYFQGEITPVWRDLEMTRIGEGVGTSGVINRPALARTLNCVARFLANCSLYEATKVKIAATSAVRDAKNKCEVAEAIMKRTGYALEILSGEQEAELSYLGAISDYLKGDTADYAVLDIGGGSTELIYFDGQKIQYKSVNLGAVRIKEDLGLKVKTGEMLEDLFGKTLPQQLKLVGVGGTITTLAAIKLELEKYDPEIIHGQTLNKEQIAGVYHVIDKMEIAERRKIKGLQPGRADIISYGVYILLKVMDKLNITELTVSEKDILYGMIIRLKNGQC